MRAIMNAAEAAGYSTRRTARVVKMLKSDSNDIATAQQANARRTSDGSSNLSYRESDEHE